MKFALASDIHLEFGDLKLNNTENADVLILAGDIFVAKDLEDGLKKAKMYREFFAQVSAEFPNIIYIMGNHEHYQGDFAKTDEIIRGEFEFLPNISFLNKQHVDIDGVRFIGSTLWTNVNKRDPLSMHVIKRSMNDFKIIDNSANPTSYRVTDESGSVRFNTRASTLTVEDTIVEHERCLEYIDQTIKETSTDMSVIVVGHHLPSFLSVAEEFATQYEMNGAYASELSDFILDRPQIKFWVHGHTHNRFDYTIGSTRILCNPRGYIGYEKIAKDFSLQFYTV